MRLKEAVWRWRCSAVWRRRSAEKALEMGGWIEAVPEAVDCLG